MNNGESFIAPGQAHPLAHYPHLRRAGGFLFLSGLSARKPDGTVAGTTIQSQTEAIISNIDTILKTTGATLRHLVDLTVYLVDMEDYSGFNEVYNQHFDSSTGPTRTTVVVKQLPGANLKIEIKAIALEPTS